MRSVVRLRGYVPHHERDTLNLTVHERRVGRMPLSPWSDTQRFARGVFWAMYLGRSLCQVLGGPEQVLRGAPAARAGRLADGVWLTASARAPADEAVYRQLGVFLAPLLDWTAERLRQERRSATAASPAPPPRVPSPAPQRWHPAGSVEVVVLPEFSTVSTGLTLDLARVPLEEDLRALSDVLLRWQLASIDGRFGGHGIHEVGQPSAEGNRVRCAVDFGDTDAARAARGLADCASLVWGGRSAGQRMRKGATFSKGDHRRHRYALWRIWDEERPLVNFIGINPSTATQRDDDRTLRRCVDFARRWGFGGVVLTNLFSFRHPQRDVMRRQTDRVGPRTDLHLVTWARRAGRVVAAWGADRVCAEREATVLGLLADVDVWCLRLTAGQRPEHPLYVPAVTKPRIYRPR